MLHIGFSELLSYFSSENPLHDHVQLQQVILVIKVSGYGQESGLTPEALTVFTCTSKSNMSFFIVSSSNFWQFQEVKELPMLVSCYLISHPGLYNNLVQLYLV
ncbi:hypothetical protein BP422_03725 [Brevibacillus formosus]|uniref:Uncharacterized protein n=1 Tax=Brevibacillus formosus TaxID=54913 RepID=A0A220MDR4_9BACL|nr:hypothetical protein BP422_03725 [Brevibacillus formosus]